MRSGKTAWILFAVLMFWITPRISRAQSTIMPATKPVWVGPMAPDVLPGNGLSQHPFFYAGEWNFPKPQQTMFVVRDGKVVWSYSIPSKDAGQDSELSDATMLSDGSVVFARKTGAGKVTADKKLVWDYEAPKGFEVHVVQPIGRDRVMYVQNGNPATLIVYNITTGKKETEFVLPTGSPTKTHGQFRRARMTAAGTFLVAHMDLGKVAEYDTSGKEIWSVEVPSPWAAVRLKNGNTLITSNKGFVREVTPQGQTVWEFTQKDVPDIRLFGIQEADRISNGNTVISNWCPNGIKRPADWPQSVQVLEVTPEKRVVWALRSWDDPANLGPATSIQLLDEPGTGENREQQR
jgi:outer membrane protein assembly factor BamB